MKIIKLSSLLFLFFITSVHFFIYLKRNDYDIGVRFNKPPIYNTVLREVFYIAGAVKSPGIYAFNSKIHLSQAIDKAGGFSEGVDVKYVNESLNLASTVKDEQHIFIPYKSSSKVEVEDEAQQELINVNTASVEKLANLPGVGPAIAQKIIQSRPYSQPENLLKVSGIGEKLVEKIANFVAF